MHRRNIIDGKNQNFNGVTNVKMDGPKKTRRSVPGNELLKVARGGGATENSRQRSFPKWIATTFIPELV